MGVIYPLFFFGAFITAVVIFLHRKISTSDGLAISTDSSTFLYGVKPKARGVMGNGPRIVSGIGLYLKPDDNAALSSIQNLTQEVEQIRAGTFNPHGSAL